MWSGGTACWYVRAVSASPRSASSALVRRRRSPRGRRRGPALGLLVAAARAPRRGAPATSVDLAEVGEREPLRLPSRRRCRATRSRPRRRCRAAGSARSRVRRRDAHAGDVAARTRCRSARAGKQTWCEAWPGVYSTRKLVEHASRRRVEHVQVGLGDRDDLAPQRAASRPRRTAASRDARAARGRPGAARRPRGRRPAARASAARAPRTRPRGRSGCG